jgi:hypothetical protein
MKYAAIIAADAAAVRALTFTIAALLALACGGGPDQGQQGEATSEREAGSSGGAGYRITHRHRDEYSKKGLGSEIVYTAELRGAPNDLIGTGRYEGKQIVRKISHAECDEPPKEYPISGNIEASGSVAELPGVGKTISYVLATTDWKLPGTEMTAEEAEAMKGGGTMSKLMLQLTGPVTRKTDTNPGIMSNSCLGEHTVTADVTVEEIR